MFRLLLILAACAATGSVNESDARPRGVATSIIAASNGGFQINTSTVSFFTGQNPFFNLWKTGQSLTLVSSVNGTLSAAAAWNAIGTGGGSYFNPATGDLNVPSPSDVTSVSRTIFTPPPQYSLLANLPGNPWWYGQTINVSWLGTSVPTIAGSNVSINVTGANTAVITLGNALTPYNLNLKFPVSNANDPPRGIVASWAFETQLGTTPFTQNYGNLIKKFGWLRVMKWTGGGPNYQSDISQLADDNYSYLAQTFSSAAMNAAWPGTVPAVGANSDFGPKGGLHPSVVVVLANATGVNPWYPVPVAISNAGMTAIATYFRLNLNGNLKVTFQYGNETCWNFAAAGPTAYVNAQLYPGTGTTGQPCPYTGYRSAQLAQIVHDVYGSSNRASWRFTVDGQQCCSATALSVIQGVEFYLANSAPANTLITDLFDEVITSNYYGNGASSITITGASAVGATTTLTTSSNPTTSFPVNSIVRLNFSVTTAGTLGALLNNVDVVISAETTGSISFTNFGGNSGSGAVNTTGLTYAAGTNYFADGLLFDLMDNSLANFISTPATFPTKYAYFTSQLWKAYQTGLADNGYAGQSVPGFSGLITDRQQNAVVAGSYGLSYRFYEGGLEDLTQLSDANLVNNTQFMDYGSNYKFDPGAVGATFTAASVTATDNAATQAAFGQYPSQFDDIIDPPSPWTPLRSYPGDIGNPYWQAILAQNALGPFVDPTAPATGTYASLGPSNFTNASSLTQTIPLTIGTVPNNSILVLALASQSSTPPTSIAVGALGNINVAAPDAPSGGCTTDCVYSFALPTSAGNPTVTVTWGTGAAFTSRCVTGFLLENLGSTAVQTSTNGGSTTNINETKGAAVIASGRWTPTPVAMTAGAQVAGAGILTPVSQQNCTSFGGAALFDFSFSSQLMPIFAPSGNLSIATYR